jgi:hypothetical protein
MPEITLYAPITDRIELIIKQIEDNKSLQKESQKDEISLCSAIYSDDLERVK